MGWLFFFVVSPWLLFAGVFLLNPDYMMKFFRPPMTMDWWMGLAMLATVLWLGFLNVAMCGVCRRLHGSPDRSAYTIIRLILTYMVAIVFWFGACSIILLTPAAFTMLEQMKNMH